MALPALLAFATRGAQADPLLEGPPVRVVPWGGGPEDVGGLGVFAEMRALGVGSAGRLAVWPDRSLGIEPQRPQLVALRLGAAGWLRTAPLGFVARVDAAELNRPLIDGPPAATVSAVIDDLYVEWTPARPASFVLGRAPVLWSKTRQWEESSDPVGAPPFLIDRVAPDRRWGLAVLGDLGAMSYAAGVYEDLDSLEPRPRPDDVSTGGRVALASHLEWTPIAPMVGADGGTPGATWPMPSPRTDPWYATLRASLGLGVLWRLDADGEQRVDVAFSTQTKWRWTALLAEAVISSYAGRTETGAHGGVVLTPIDAVALVGRVEWDPGAGVDGRWALLGGVTYHRTKDRRNKIGLIGWFRRDVERGTLLDGVVVLLQAAL